MRSRIFATTRKLVEKNNLWQQQLQSQRYFHTSKPTHPSIIEKINTIQLGTANTPDWRLFFETKPSSVGDNQRISPWHDIPLGFESHQSTILFNYINEIPKGDRAKMECTPKEEWNPLKQDVKKGNLRFFKYGDIPFNYGFIPQTWEDPTISSEFVEMGDLKGDNDPIDVVEISGRPIPRGHVMPVKVLSVLGLIDEGEADWKILALRADHPQASRINTIEDAERILEKNFKEAIVDWFQKYKVPDGKPENKFTHNAKFHDPDMAVGVVEEGYRHWYDLIIGAVKTPNHLQSVTRTYLINNGLTSDKRTTQKPLITYSKYTWNANPTSTVDQAKIYVMEEQASNQNTRK